ncbi:hexokinase [Marchantia polymorpha subsp. ruderalis]|uniref:Phosphotransferase n=2 Tax=Marchantia polymorpha TaxID=3197 RepID=A0AAF6AXF2_MARPO|nr:hypothetical protein MARPO_0022s0069 [Marchantia polymorpha]BBN04436.1 hypothetical protein Mp_3g04590 [Marchantia polymorpha subsp. ruderalis]|eukprot:PTQ43965.1 hypothetical protein MARPO_0022s0069 [Marchantia polymorpha]
MSALITHRSIEAICQLPQVPELRLPTRSSRGFGLRVPLGDSLARRACVSWGSHARTDRGRRSVSYSLSRRQEPGVLVLAGQQQEAQRVLDEFREACATPLEKLEKVVDSMVLEMEAGLAAEDGCLLKMLPSFVENLPKGTERGIYYALDLGGTNFRVLRAVFGGPGEGCMQESEIFTIPHDLMVGESDDLFDFIASKLRDFVLRETENKSPPPGRKRELGFTFSFPVMQTSVASGTLIHWSKGFKVAGTVGRDVVEVLREAISRQNLDMEVAALVNDTVGTLAGGRYINGDVMIAVILGTGTNACYVERAEAVPKWKGPPPKSGIHVINTEWGNFGSPTLPTTFADDDLDRESVNPSEHIFEKMMSGMYLGDLVRRVMLRLAKDAGYFGDSIPEKLTKKLALTTPDISKMHADDSPTLEVVGEILKKKLDLDPTRLEERRVVYSIIDIIARRGARLAAAAIVAVLRKIGRDGKSGNGTSKTVIAMDGGLYEHYTKFRDYLNEAFVDLLGEEAAKNVVIELSKDGSGIGAALLAACHSKYGSQ